MAGHEGSNHELSLFAVAVAAAACVFAAAVNYVAAASKDDIAKASVISSLQIAHSQRARNDANPTGPSAITARHSPRRPIPSQLQRLRSTRPPGENVSKKLNQSNGVVHPTSRRRRGLQAAPPRRSQNERPLLALGSR